METTIEIDKEVDIERVFFKARAERHGPTVVFFAGIHGNEPAGLLAIQELQSLIQQKLVKGQVVAIAGNLAALRKKQRFIEQDLNRLWTPKQLRKIFKKDKLTIDQKQQKEIYQVLKEILKTNNGPFYFIDLHTTSSESPPFITINDAMINRKFSTMFPVATVLGIEEYLSGPLLSYINSLGYVSLGFEAGQHENLQSIQNCKAFISLVLENTGLIKRADEVFGKSTHAIFKQQWRDRKLLYEVIYTENLNGKDKFVMNKGYSSFQTIAKGENLAFKNKKQVVSPYFGRIFMPLYQSQGEEGFFIIQLIPRFIIWLSAKVRVLKLDGIFSMLPGVNWKNNKKNCLLINTKIALFLPKEIFHLFGYRQKQLDKSHIKAYNRERVAKTEMYKNEVWY